VSEYADSLSRLNRIPGVRGSMIVAAEDGLIVEEDLMAGIPGSAVAALAASVFARAVRSVAAAELGGVTWLQLDATGGFMFAAAPPRGSDLLLVVITERAVNVGLVRIEATRIAAGFA
jgi:predicted regulator of Ras-like GTPase activity (Roadblock/LC7/MglB family)